MWHHLKNSIKSTSDSFGERSHTVKSIAESQLNSRNCMSLSLTGQAGGRCSLTSPCWSWCHTCLQDIPWLNVNIIATLPHSVTPSTYFIQQYVSNSSGDTCIYVETISIISKLLTLNKNNNLNSASMNISTLWGSAFSLHILLLKTLKSHFSSSNHHPGNQSIKDQRRKI